MHMLHNIILVNTLVMCWQYQDTVYQCIFESFIVSKDIRNGTNMHHQDDQSKLKFDYWSNCVTYERGPMDIESTDYSNAHVTTGVKGSRNE